MFLSSVFLLTPVVALIVVGILVLVFSRAIVDTTLGILIRDCHSLTPSPQV
jgi:uncharacterized membrane protein YqiK